MRNIHQAPGTGTASYFLLPKLSEVKLAAEIIVTAPRLHNQSKRCEVIDSKKETVHIENPYN
jgi:hypothetical protein